MHRRILSLSLVIFLGILIINWSCTKIDTTTLGDDLIPAVDNVNTFADTFFINATQHNFDDTTYVPSTDDHALGNINNDPLFGKGTAHAFFQMKPTSFPFAFGNKDSLLGLGLDSVVLCLSYKYFWGDSTAPQKLQVFAVTDTAFRDSAYKSWLTNTQPTVNATAISAIKDIDVRTLKNQVVIAHGKDSATNQIRIKLNNPYASDLFGSDSMSTGSGNHAFYNDSLYRRAFNGLAVKAVGTGLENGFMYINLADANTRLEFHYRIRNAGKIDTTFTNFKLRTSLFGTAFPSATANYINQDRSGSPAATPGPNEIFLQAQPGTYASLDMSPLNGYTNRIVHRAELIVEQIPDNPFYDSAFTAPDFLYLDLKDPGTPVKYKPLYIALNPSSFYDPDNITTYFYPPEGPDFGSFGGFIRRRTGPLGASINYYNINISRHIQQMVTKQNTNYDMRLFAAYRFHYPQYSGRYLNYPNNVALGRVRVGDSSHPNYPLRLRVVYSKIK